MRDHYIEMTFDDAVEAAKELCDLPNDQIIELRLHPDGLWTVRWNYSLADGTIWMRERPLNIEKIPSRGK